jgi:predicted DNA binding CopG/RHH family protein
MTNDQQTRHCALVSHQRRGRRGWSNTIRLEEETIEYFKKLSAETGLPYQTLINLYLRDCAQQERKLEWV